MDADFIEELTNTDKVKMIKDLYDYLPYKRFYLDISDSKDFCEKLNCKGMFVEVYKTDGAYGLNICKIDDTFYYQDTIVIANDDYEMETDNEVLPIKKINGEIDSIKAEVDNVHIGLMKTFVQQTLTYLSSNEPDIRENPTTKRTYKKPNPAFKPKNKFSEVRMQDVGVRFGSAFRVWRIINKDSELNKELGIKSDHAHTGRKQRPHFRRGHWHTYLYGKGKTEKKVVWQHEMYINLDLGEVDATIHKVERGKYDKGSSHIRKE